MNLYVVIIVGQQSINQSLMYYYKHMQCVFNGVHFVSDGSINILAPYSSWWLFIVFLPMNKNHFMVFICTYVKSCKLFIVHDKLN